MKGQRISKVRNNSGQRKILFNNGKLMIIEKIVNGKIVEGKYYNNKGEKVSEIKNGNGIKNIHYLNGKIQSIQEYKNGLVDGIIKIYNENGKLEAYSEAKNGKCCFFEYYDEKGNITSTAGKKRKK